MNLADNLKKIRKDNNLSQEQLAEKLGVSRQSVSKWESGQSYPEMDKVLQLCKLFKLNINELINENVSDVIEKKDVKRRSSKYISSFFEYITKVVDMFSSMKFKQIILCLIEQIIICSIIVTILLLLGLIGGGIFYNIFRFLPSTLFDILYALVKGLYIFISVILGLAIMLHIFKIRYLDYYEIVIEDKDTLDENLNEIDLSNNKDEKNIVYLEKKKDKVIIRDPKHSNFSFLSGLGKVVIFFGKFIAGILLFSLVFLLLGLVALLACSFLFVKTGLMFISMFILLIGCIAFNVLIIEILYNFIVNKRINKTKVFIISIISIIMIGLGGGFSVVSVTKFDYVEKEIPKEKETFEIEMNDNLKLYNDCFYCDYVFVEKDIDNINIEVEYPIYKKVSVYSYNDFINIYSYRNDSETMKLIRSIIKDINDKKIYSYFDSYKVVITASTENISKIKENTQKYYDEVDRLRDENNSLRYEIYDLDERNRYLESLLESSSLNVIYDDNGNIIGIDDNNYEKSTE